jgi:uncharacterized membrane protein YedE/YeeE
LAIILSNRLSLCNCQPRTPANISLPPFNNVYNGNLIGGILLGLGMTLTGACPGTVFPQVATGISSAKQVLVGAAIGGIVYSWLKPRIQATAIDKKQTAFTKPTAPQRAGIDAWTGLTLYEILCMTLVAGAVYIYPTDDPSLVNPVLGGILIGLSQFTSLLLTSSSLGISSAFEQFGDLLWWFLAPSHQPRPSTKATAFALGTLSGSWVLIQLTNVPTPREMIAITTSRAILGGVSLIVGSRIAGGCTSGHGISGMSMLSVASFVTVGGMFAGGMGSAAVFREVGW